MLQAWTETGGFITPALLSKAELETIRLYRRFFCPECKEKVIFRAGQKVIPHFAHQRDNNCSQKGGESFYHMKGKLQLYHWLRRQYQEVYLEKYISEIKQRPDIVVKIAHRTVAIELQCAIIDPRIIRKRNKGYKKAGIMPIWLLGANCFKRIGKHKIKVNSFTIEVLQKFSSDTGSHIIYYCPETHAFFKASDLHMTSSYAAIANLTHHNALHTTFPNLIRSTFLNKRELYRAWLHEKKRLRLGYGRLYGRELQWRHWLYKQGLTIDQLPAVAHLPVPAQHSMNVPLWHWQSRFLLDFLHPLHVKDCFSLKEVDQFLKPFKKSIRSSLLIQTVEDPIHQYLRLLRILGYIQHTARDTFQKMLPIAFPVYIEEALDADRNVLQKLLQEGQETMDW